MQLRAKTTLLKNKKYAPEENFCGHFALAERLPTSATLPLMKAKFVNKVYVSGF